MLPFCLPQLAQKISRDLSGILFFVKKEAIKLLTANKDQRTNVYFRNFLNLFNPNCRQGSRKICHLCNQVRNNSTEQTLIKENSSYSGIVGRNNYEISVTMTYSASFKLSPELLFMLQYFTYFLTIISMSSVTLQITCYVWGRMTISKSEYKIIKLKIILFLNTFRSFLKIHLKSLLFGIKPVVKCI